MHSTARWTTGLAAAALIAVPAAGFAQSTTSAPPAPPAQTAAPQTATPPAQTAAPQTPAPQTSDSTGSPVEHVRQAKEALSSIPTASLTPADRAKVTQIRTHLTALEKAVASPAAAPAPRVVNGRSTKSSNNWATDVAEIDTILTGLIGPETAASDATAATPTGTSGSTSALNDQARTQLQIVRRHMTALASAMSGTSPATTTAPASSPDMTAAASQAAAAAAAGATSATPPASATSATPPASATSTTPPASATSTTPPASATSATPPASAAATPPATSAAAAAEAPAAAPQTPAGGSPVDTAAAKQHLSEARDSLSQLTSLPEAAKLQGDARTQVSQLISNFNELISTPVDWRASYAKVDGSLTTLLGPNAGQQPPASATDATASGVTGATGTSGTVPPASAQATTAQLDPAIRTKLVEFRTHLKAFEQAAGGGTPKTVQ